MDKVYFQNSKGNRLCGILSEPQRGETSPLVILAHGFSSHKNTTNFVKIAELLNRKKIATLRIDLYAHGESEGEFERITISKAVDDILQAIAYVKEKGYTKIGLIGSSFGGIASIIAASKTPDLKFLALKSPVSDYGAVMRLRMSEPQIKDWQKQGYTYLHDAGKRLKVNYTFFQDFQKNRAYLVASKIKIPTLIIHGDVDSEVPLSQSKRLVQLIPHAKLHIVNGADHRYQGEGEIEECINKIVNFTVKHLQ